MEIRTGNIFSTKCQTIVNTVNCVGVMGAGIALECRLRHPEMYERYRELCDENLIAVGKLWLYKESDRWILNFPTKKHWKRASKPEYLQKGLDKFLATYEEKGVTSIAFPLLGASHGGLDPERSLDIMSEYLKQCNIPVEIWKYDPEATDDLYPQFRASFKVRNEEKLAEATGLRRNYLNKVIDALDRPDVNSISRLSSVKGIGVKTLERCFEFVRNEVQQRHVQNELF